MASKGNLNIAMDPDVAAAFAASTAVSTSKGIGANCKYNFIRIIQVNSQLYFYLFSIETRHEEKKNDRAD